MNPGDEVVTRALARDVELPGGAGTAVLITLDNGLDHTRPTTLGRQGLAAIEAAVTTALGRDDVAAVCVTGKPYVFAVGADLTMFGADVTRADVLAVGRTGHRVFRTLYEARVPTFALINGAALGGGLELALHCHYRSISGGVAAIGLPECSLGLVPAWGGSTLLPWLVGPAAAVKIIVENPLDSNRLLSAPAALRLGVADVLFEPADFLEQSLAWVGRVVAGAEALRRSPLAGPPGDSDESTWTAAVSRGRAVADARVQGAAPAPYRALELIAAARTADLDAGTAAEDQALADLVGGEETRASLYAFDLVRRRAKRPGGAPPAALARPVTKVGILGAGLMAGQLALLFGQRLRVPVVLTDVDEGKVERGVADIHARIEERRDAGKLTADAAHRLTALVMGRTSLADFADADLVIEAVFEELSVKREVLAAVEAVVSAGCVLATNTSALSVTDMASGLRHPQRLVGLHFFNPVAVLPLVEVIRTPHTDEPTLATAFALGKELKKSCVLVRDAPAFVVNRLLTRLLGEVLAAVDSGTPIAVADAALAPIGLPMSPLALLELVGPGVALHVAERLHEAFPARFAVSGWLRALVDAGRTSIYLTDASGRRAVDPALAGLVAGTGAPWSADEVRARALDALADEARRLLDEEVVAAPQDIDLCMILGAGWPLHLGGITPYLDRTGISARATGRRFLPPGAATLPQRH